MLRVATNLGASISVVAADGTVLAAYGREPDGDTTHYSSPIVVDGVPVATLEATLPSRGTDRAFLPLFNVTLIVAGFVSVLGIVLVSASIAARLTRPLRDVASAARRLEAGDAGARATGGDDLDRRSSPMRSTRWPTGSSGPRCCDAVPPATSPTTWPRPRPSWSPSSRR